MKSMPLKQEVPMVTLVSPAHVRRNIERALNDTPDTPHATVFDLEDSVPQNKKDEAVNNTTHYFEKPKSRPVWVRTNPLNPSSGDRDFEDDAKHLKQPIQKGKVEGLHIPKITSPKDIETIIKILDESPVNFSCIIETKLALQHLREILDAIQETKSAIGVSLGWEDIAQEYGIFKPENIFENGLLKDIATKVVSGATSRNIAVQDGVNRTFGNFDIMKPLLKQTREMSQMGVNGKIAIHPNQIPVIEEGFSPTTEQIKWANAVISCVEKNFGSVDNYLESPGPFNFNGSMGVVRVVMQALQILDHQKST